MCLHGFSVRRSNLPPRADTDTVKIQSKSGMDWVFVQKFVLSTDLLGFLKPIELIIGECVTLCNKL